YRFTLRGFVEQCGGSVTDLGSVPDERDVLRAQLLEASRIADVVMTSGGVSVGIYDLVKAVLGEIGGIDFWQVAMQPGRPLAVGRIGDAHFFGLPGNPVASSLTFMLFVRPALFKLAGRRRLFPEAWQARAIEPMRKKTGRREFKRGVLKFADGGWEVRTTGPQGSGILSSMVIGNCLIVLEEDRGDVAAGLGVRVLAGDRALAPGYLGLARGAADVEDLPRVIRDALERAYRRALVNAEMKADAREKFGPLGAALADTRLHPIDALEDTVAAVYERDPRAMRIEDILAYTVDISRQVAAVDRRLTYNWIATLTQLSRELFASSEGSLIDQAFALTQGSCSVVGLSGAVSQDLYDVVGHQRGWEILERGVDEALIRFPAFPEFCLGLAREAVALSQPPALPTSE